MIITSSRYEGGQIDFTIQVTDSKKLKETSDSWEGLAGNEYEGLFPPPHKTSSQTLVSPLLSL